ncbi:hypothetical protein L798_14903 [Zootermopsis nevadensis]|uniref:Uncharacterized protein n=1 Tax=Zootermopsis nevadensis TaxID=136037 RepID=A0A067R055_ZOONE|nr:hypothetical protein L798_14903 [Zootermopsis nevadensis]
MNIGFRILKLKNFQTRSVFDLGCVFIYADVIVEIHTPVD